MLIDILNDSATMFARVSPGLFLMAHFSSTFPDPQLMGLSHFSCIMAHEASQRHLGGLSSGKQTAVEEVELVLIGDGHGQPALLASMPRQTRPM